MYYQEHIKKERSIYIHLQLNHTNFEAMAITLENFPSLFRRAEGRGPIIRVPTGSSLSFSRMILCESYRGRLLLVFRLLTMRAL